MCSVIHVGAGALIGGLVGERWTALFLGIASHIPLDLFPHIDFRDFRMDAVYSGALLLAIWFLTGFSPILLGAIGAVAPDFENLLWKAGWIAEGSKVFPTHSGMLKHGFARFSKGPFEEALLSLMSMALVLAAVVGGGYLR